MKKSYLILSLWGSRFDILATNNFKNYWNDNNTTEELSMNLNLIISRVVGKTMKNHNYSLLISWASACIKIWCLGPSLYQDLTSWQEIIWKITGQAEDMWFFTNKKLKNFCEKISSFLPKGIASSRQRFLWTNNHIIQRLYYNIFLISYFFILYNYF